jgi:lipopolysaccharide/colanic/teichoic acid biosynthesis glycosyltransferase
MLKRGFDIVCSFAGLLFLSSMMLLIALAIRLDSPGPVLFRQERVGRGGAIFRIHKFRTMVADTPRRGPPLTAGADDRITRVGRWLRRYKLDELPQMLDVLAGDMSIVGPRPEIPDYVRLYPDHLRVKVLSVPPGMTDPASLFFLNESDILGRATDPEQTYLKEILPRKLALAADYVDRRTILLDIRIILRTLMRIVGLRGQRS